MIPFIGQAVSAKKALKIAKESGEEMLTVFRGVEKWYPGQMVKEGKFISGETPASFRATRKSSGHVFYTTPIKGMAENYAGIGRSAWHKHPEGRLLEFEVPESYVNRYRIPGLRKRIAEGVADEQDVIFKGGLPKEFLIKVHE